MVDLKSRNIPFYWSYMFLKTLLTEGVEHIVISPGSRSTPLTLAADAHPGFKKHVILDERSAAFTALGIGKSTGYPAVLICTSGTAAANYYPGVIESRQAGVPLIVLTADRPPKLRDVGANQAVNQLNIYGSYPVWFHEIGEPNTDISDIRRLQRAASQSVHYSYERRGPSHLNFAFRKPLEPTPAFVKKIANENESESEFSPNESFTAGKELSSSLSSLEDQLHKAERPIIIAGPEDPTFAFSSWTAEISSEFNIPVLAEAGSNIHCPRQQIDGFSAFLRHPDRLEELTPDLILRIGQQPVTKALHRYIIEHQDIPHYHLSNHPKLQDGQLATDHFYYGVPSQITPSSFKKRRKWWEAWKHAQQTTQDIYESIMTNSDMRDGDVIHRLIHILPDRWSLVLSNSFPVRDATLFGGDNFSSHNVYVNRGASGIDGITSTAIGIAVGENKPALLLTGDLSVLHDTNGLLNASLLSVPLVIAIINNEGGSIFRMLPIAKHEGPFAKYFETPQNADFSSMADTYGITYQKIDTPADLESLAFDQFQDKPGLHFLEFQTNPALSMKQRRTLWKSDQIQ